MGLDIYGRWDGITDQERSAQFTGWIPSPQTGYLRYSYRYATYLELIADKDNLPNPLRDFSSGVDSAIWACNDVEYLKAYRQRLWDSRPNVTFEDVHTYTQRELQLLADFSDENPNEEYLSYRDEWVAFIDFLLSKADKPNLRIEFR